MLRILSFSVVVGSLSFVAKSWFAAKREYRIRSEFLHEDRKLVLITNPKQCSAALRLIGDVASVGLDAEWNPKSDNLIALLQIATTSVVALFRVADWDVLPPCLIRFLEDARIQKVGVGISNDAARLHAGFGVTLRGSIDLNSFASLLGVAVPSGSGLKTFAKCLLDIELDKREEIRCSNWEAPQLSGAQLRYAAQDAIIALDCFLAMSRGSEEMMEKVESIVDPHIRAPLLVKKVRSVKVAAGGTKRQKTSFRHPTIKGELYHNCKMLAPYESYAFLYNGGCRDGTLLCACHRRKVQWYVDHGIADVVCEDPYTIRLHFEPAGRGHAGDQYYLSAKDNKCVVCGSVLNLMRFNVVPQCYRRYFPARLKSHASHDVVLMCTDCHRHAQLLAETEHDAIATDLGVIDRRAHLTSPRVTLNEDTLAVSKAARALRFCDSLPSTRVAELEEVVSSYLQLHPVEMTEGLDMLEYLSALDAKVNNPDHEPYGKAVISLVGPHGIGAFVRRWRVWMIESLKPRHLPSGWSVDHYDMTPEKHAELTTTTGQMGRYDPLIL